MTERIIYCGIDKIFTISKFIMRTLLGSKVKFELRNMQVNYESCICTFYRSSNTWPNRLK